MHNTLWTLINKVKNWIRVLSESFGKPGKKRMNKKTKTKNKIVTFFGLAAINAFGYTQQQLHMGNLNYNTLTLWQQNKGKTQLQWQAAKLQDFWFSTWASVCHCWLLCFLLLLWLFGLLLLLLWMHAKRFAAQKSREKQFVKRMVDLAIPCRNYNFLIWHRVFYSFTFRWLQQF